MRERLEEGEAELRQVALGDSRSDEAAGVLRPVNGQGRELNPSPLTIGPRRSSLILCRHHSLSPAFRFRREREAGLVLLRLSVKDVRIGRTPASSRIVRESQRRETIARACPVCDRNPRRAERRVAPWPASSPRCGHMAWWLGAVLLVMPDARQPGAIVLASTFRRCRPNRRQWVAAIAAAIPGAPQTPERRSAIRVWRPRLLLSP